MTEPLQQRASERTVYETVVNMIVDAVNKEFPVEEESRLRIYKLVADNFDGMVRALRPIPGVKSVISIQAPIKEV
jgi:hypothetical protein